MLGCFWTGRRSFRSGSGESLVVRTPSQTMDQSSFPACSSRFDDLQTPNSVTSHGPCVRSARDCTSGVSSRLSTGSDGTHVPSVIPVTGGIKQNSRCVWYETGRRVPLVHSAQQLLNFQPITDRDRCTRCVARERSREMSGSSPHARRTRSRVDHR